MDAPFTGIEETNETEMQFKVFPNPVNDLLNLQISNPNGTSINFEIISLLGNTELSGAIQPYEKQKTFNLEEFASGIYMLVLNYDGKKEIRKFVINK